VLKEGVSLQEAVAKAREKAKEMKEEGVDQAALDAAAAKGFGNALFEYDEDEMSQVVEEFYPDAAHEDSRNGASAVSKLKDNLISTKLVSG
jgi:hypothetical protein